VWQEGMAAGEAMREAKCEALFPVSGITAANHTRPDLQGY